MSYWTTAVRDAVREGGRRRRAQRARALVLLACTLGAIGHLTWLTTRDWLVAADVTVLSLFVLAVWFTRRPSE